MDTNIFYADEILLIVYAVLSPLSARCVLGSLAMRRLSVKQERLREREAGLVSAVASLESEKDSLSRRLEMATER